MKRLILLLTITILLVFIIFFLTRHPHRPLSPIDLLPRNTAALIEGPNLAQQWDRWRQGLVGSSLLRQDVPLFWCNEGADPGQANTLSSLLTSLERMARRDGFYSLFSRPSVVALLPPPPGVHLTEDTVLKRLLVVHQLHLPQVTPRILAVLFGNITALTNSVFQGQVLTHLRFEQGQELTCFVHDRLLIWSMDDRVIHSSVNHLLRQLIPVQAGMMLVSSPYARLKQIAVNGPGETFAYLRPRALCPMLPNLLRDLGEIGRYFPDHIALSSSTTAQGGRLVLSALADSGQFAALKKHYQLRDDLEHPLGEPSSETVLAFWTNWLKPIRVWHWLQPEQGATHRGVLDQWLGTLAGKNGASLQTILDLFGNEFELQIDHLRTPHQLPRAMASISVEVRDETRVAQLLKRLLKGLQTIDVVSNDLHIVSLLLAEGLLQPAYALVNKRLILADNMEMIENRHKAPDAGYAATDFPRRKFRRQGSNFFLFLRTSDMVEWLLPVLTAIAKEYGGRPGETLGDWFLFRPQVLSFMAELQSVKSNRIRGYLYKDEAFLEVLYTLAR
jgi:hypothetical protein